MSRVKGEVLNTSLKRARVEKEKDELIPNWNV